MRPNKTENVPIIRTLNNLSSKLLDSVNPVDSINEQGHRAQDNVDIKLHDLQNDSRQQKILLNVRDHRQFFNVEYQTSEVKAQETLNRDTTGVDILLKLFQNTASHKSLTRRPSDHSLVHEAQQWHPRSIERGISDDNNPALRGASTHISTILAIRRVQMPGSFGSISIPDSQIWDQLLLTHATSTEFLRHFWGAFFSGDPKKISDVRNMASSLSRSLERIEFIATSAEEKEKSNTETGRGDPDRKRSRGSHRPLNERGYVLVKKVITPQENAIKTALAKYQQALQSTCDSN